MNRLAKWTRKKMENCGSVMMSYGSGLRVNPEPDPTPDHARDPSCKLYDVKNFFLLLFEVTFTSFFKDKKS
jgi:hypothetical protein